MENVYDNEYRGFYGTQQCSWDPAVSMGPGSSGWLASYPQGQAALRQAGRQAGRQEQLVDEPDQPGTGSPAETCLSGLAWRCTNFYSTAGKSGCTNFPLKTILFSFTAVRIECSGCCWTTSPSDDLPVIGAVTRRLKRLGDTVTLFLPADDHPEHWR